MKILKQKKTFFLPTDESFAFLLIWKKKLPKLILYVKLKRSFFSLLFCAFFVNKVVYISQEFLSNRVGARRKHVKQIRLNGIRRCFRGKMEYFEYFFLLQHFSWVFTPLSLFTFRFIRSNIGTHYRFLFFFVCSVRIDFVLGPGRDLPERAYFLWQPEVDVDLTFLEKY